MGLSCFTAISGMDGMGMDGMEISVWGYSMSTTLPYSVVDNFSSGRDDIQMIKLSGNAPQTKIQL